MAYVGVAALLCVPLTWLSRAVSRAREEARAAQCIGNLKQLGLALLNYESKYGCFPPAYVADAKGQRLYSWRVLLMAECDRAAGWFGGRLAGGFHFDEPWDSPNNRKLHGLALDTVLQCPSDRSQARSTETNVVAVVGPGTMFPSDGSSRKLADVSDGLGDTFAVVEVARAGIHWMEPKELELETMSFTINDPSRLSVSSNHPFDRLSHPGPHVLTVDDMVTGLPRNLSPATLKALLTIAGGEKVERTDWHRRP